MISSAQLVCKDMYLPQGHVCLIATLSSLFTLLAYASIPLDYCPEHAFMTLNTAGILAVFRVAVWPSLLLPRLCIRGVPSPRPYKPYSSSHTGIFSILHNINRHT